MHDRHGMHDEHGMPIIGRRSFVRLLYYHIGKSRQKRMRPEHNRLACVTCMHDRLACVTCMHDRLACIACMYDRLACIACMYGRLGIILSIWPTRSTLISHSTREVLRLDHCLVPRSSDTTHHAMYHAMPWCIARALHGLGGLGGIFSTKERPHSCQP